MSIFGKPVSALTPDDLQSLRTEGLTEGIRLEYKSEFHNGLGKEQTVKELAAFANTFGGYLVLGVTENASKGIDSFSGLDPETYRDHDSRVVQWCMQEAFPPLRPFVSPPIPSPGDPDRVCYVIHVEPSMQAPHVLEKRKGIYVRNGDQSTPFEARLATLDEITDLLGRREKAEDRREALWTRSRQRHDRHLQAVGGAQGHAIARLGVLPLYPSVAKVEALALKQRLLDSRFVHGHQRARVFPREQFYSQEESQIQLGFDSSGTFLEATVYGSLYYGTVVPSNSFPEGDRPTILFSMFFADVLRFLMFAARAFPLIYGEGLARVHLRLEDVRRRRWLLRDDISGMQGDEQTVLFDDSMTAVHDVSTDQLAAPTEILALLIADFLAAFNSPHLIDNVAALVENTVTFVRPR